MRTKNGSALVYDLLSKEQILKEAFRPLSQKKRAEKSSPQKIESSKQIICKIPNQEIDKDLVSLLLFQDRQKLDDHLMSFAPIPLTKKPSSFSDSELFSLELIIPTSTAPLTQSSPSLQDPLSHPEAPLIDRKGHAIASQEAPPLSYDSSLDLENLSDEGVARRAALAAPAPLMPIFPSLNELETASYSDWFDLDLICTPSDNGKGYFFALTLVPRFELNFSTIRQHYTFLIDRSNSIQKDRLLATKNAVLRALEELAPGDTFNIFAFDSKVEKLFPTSRKVDPLTLSLTRTWLAKVDLGSFFSPADLSHPLMLTLPHQVEEDEIHTVFLLTDGEALIKKNALYTVLQNWTVQSQGTVSLFAVCMNSDSQQNALNAVTALNKGWVVTSPTKKGLKRKVLKLMKSVHTPIAKNLSCKIIPLSGKGKVELDPQPIPHLYLDQPFVLLGYTESCDNFIVFLQGRLNDRWVNIKKKVSFLSAKQGSVALKKEWALKNSYHCYERYLSDRNPSHLEKARDLLADFDLQPLLP